MALQAIKPHVFPDEELGGMHVPTLLLIGQQEALYDSAALERVRRLIPNLEGELVPRASHDMTMGQHERVNKRVLAFLKGAAQQSLAANSTPGA